MAGEGPPTPETAFTAHERLVTIHPFADGNGRTARLLMSLVLLKGGYPPVVVGPEHRAAHIDSLQALQLGCDPAPNEKFMSERLEAGLDHTLAMLNRGLDQGSVL
jgi:Fic family protein